MAISLKQAQTQQVPKVFVVLVDARSHSKLSLA